MAPPCSVVVFGATGDLTRRKLMPALFRLHAVGSLPEACAIVGCARRDMSRSEFAEFVAAALVEHSPLAKEDPAAVREFVTHIDYVAGEFTHPETYARLRETLGRLDNERHLEGNSLFYLAVPPSEFEPILEHLRDGNFVRAPKEPSWSRVVIEKPFGRDLESARELNSLVGRVLDESQTFRIDHYLGKETVQNILVLRFANSIFEPLWSRKYIHHVEISAVETVGIGTRGRFYESTGVLRDIMQNHLLELLCLTAMEPPNSGEADDVRTEKLKVLGALREPWSDTIPRDVVLGQYRGYREEPDVAPDSTTPTYAAVRVFIDNWRWQGVPFYLRAGKKLAKRVTEIALHLERVPLSLFGREDVCENLEPNVLVMRIQPDEGIRLRFACKIPGFDTRVGSVIMDMDYVETFGGEPPEAYERLLLDAMRGDATLFSRRDAVEASWQWIQPILDHFEAHPPQGFPNYEPGSWGPTAADDLLRRDRRMWRRLD